jgi:4-hydroxybenzoate polyprenyltransferase
VNIISKFFWKRAVRHEMLSAAKILALVAGLLLILSAILGPTSLVLGLILGGAVILLAGRLKHRLWSGGFLVAGLVSYASLDGIMAQGGAILVMAAAALGLASTFM